MPKTRKQASTKPQEKSLTDHPYFTSKEQSLATNEDYEKLPNSVKYRLQSLRHLQIQQKQNEINFENELLHLQNKYHKNQSSLYEKRSKIINGTYEPSKNEILSFDGITDGEKFEPNKVSCGIPEFWFKVFENNSVAECWIEENGADELLLKSHLKDVKLSYHNSLNPDHEIDYPTEDCEKGEGDVEPAPTLDIDMFKITFHFSPNNYFHNSTLTKTFYMRTVPSPDETSCPFNFDRSEIYKSIGSGVQWKNAKNNLSGEMRTKKQKNKSTGQTRVVPYFESKDTFFNFFKGIEVSEPKEDELRAKYKNKTEEDIQELLQEHIIDFDFGTELKDTIIPKAAIIFTDEYIDEEEDSDLEESSDEEGESGQDSGNSDESEDSDEGTAVDNPDCQQQ